MYIRPQLMWRSYRRSPSAFAIMLLISAWLKMYGVNPLAVFLYCGSGGM